VRPVILFEYQDEIVEDRSYTNTTGEAIEQGLLRFRDGGFTDKPFMVKDGFGNESLVYQRQTVIAGYDAERNGEFLPAVVVYYDVLSLNVKIQISAGTDPPSDNQPPNIVMRRIQEGDTFRVGRGVLLGARATDADGTVTSVHFYANGEAACTDSTRPFRCSWQPTETGTYVITAEAVDDAGATATSNGVTVEVVAGRRSRQ
jgi:hypothetical protein